MGIAAQHDTVETADRGEPAADWQMPARCRCLSCATLIASLGPRTARPLTAHRTSARTAPTEVSLRLPCEGIPCSTSLPPTRS